VQHYAPHIDQRAKKFRNENSLKGIYGPVYESTNNNFPAGSRERKVFYRPQPVRGSQTMKSLSKKNDSTFIKTKNTNYNTKEMNSKLENRNFKPHYLHQREIDKVNDWLFGQDSWMSQVDRLDTKRIGPDNELKIRYNREKRAWDKRPSLLGWVFESNQTPINEKRATVHESQRSSKAIPTPLRGSQAMKRLSKASNSKLSEKDYETLQNLGDVEVGLYGGNNGQPYRATIKPTKAKPKIAGNLKALYTRSQNENMPWSGLDSLRMNLITNPETPAQRKKMADFLNYIASDYQGGGYANYEVMPKIKPGPTRSSQAMKRLSEKNR
jgi:hypothetical protein